MKRQRGAIAIMAGVWVLVAIVVLGTIDIGNLYFQRRDLQRIADMAALAAAQSVDPTDVTCASAIQAAQGIAAANDSNTVSMAPPKSGQDQISMPSPPCGRWDPSAPTIKQTGATQFNAAKVTMTRSMSYSFLGLLSGPSGPPTVSASSTARATAIDAFEIGTTLVAFGGNNNCAPGGSAANPNSGVVNALLSALLQTNLGISIASYQGLACTNVKVSDLVKASQASGASVSFASVNDLLKASMSISDLATLINGALPVSAPGTNGAAAQTALNAIANAKIVTKIPVTNSTGANAAAGLLNIGATNPQAVANTSLNLLDVMMTAAQVTAKTVNPNGPAVQVQSGILLNGLLSTTLKVQIVNPPAIGIGEAGIDPVTNSWRTQATTSQVRLFLNIDLGNTQPISIGSLPGLTLTLILKLINLLGSIVQFDVHLPIYLDVAQGTAWLQSTDCGATLASSTVRIGAQTGIVNACIGDPPASMTANAQQPFSCSTAATLVTIGASTPPSIAITGNVPLLASVPASQSPTLTFDGVTGNSDDYQSINANGIGSVLNGTVKSLESSSGLTVYVQGQPTVASSLLTPVINVLVAALSPLLTATGNPSVTPLDQMVVPLLNLLGAQIGVATVHNTSLTCNAAQLVNN